MVGNEHGGGWLFYKRISCSAELCLLYKLDKKAVRRGAIRLVTRVIDTPLTMGWSSEVEEQEGNQGYRGEHYTDVTAHNTSPYKV